MYNTVARKGFIHVMHKPQSVFSLDVGEKNLLMEIPTSFSLVSLLHFYVLVKCKSYKNVFGFSNAAFLCLFELYLIKEANIIEVTDINWALICVVSMSRCIGEVVGMC